MISQAHLIPYNTSMILRCMTPEKLLEVINRLELELALASTDLVECRYGLVDATDELNDLREKVWKGIPTMSIEFRDKVIALLRQGQTDEAIRVLEENDCSGCGTADDCDEVKLELQPDNRIPTFNIEAIKGYSPQVVLHNDGSWMWPVAFQQELKEDFHEYAVTIDATGTAFREAVTEWVTKYLLRGVRTNTVVKLGDKNTLR